MPSAPAATHSSATRPHARRSLQGAVIAHALHDGYTDMIYVLLPVWQAEFALGYAALAALRAVYAGTMAAFQVPAGWLADRGLGGRTVLVAGTVLSALGYALAGFSAGLATLCAALALSGIGSSTQHPLASAAVSRAYGSGARGPLGIYNFSGDLGKAALPALLGLLIAAMAWRSALWLIAALGLLAAAAIWMLLPLTGAADATPKAGRGADRGGFGLLLAIGVLDSGVRMGFLTFLPFVLKAKGAELPLIGFAFTLVFLGGAAGKFACGWLGARFGVLATVLATEIGTAVAIGAAILLPLSPVLVLLPFLGVMLNGTSSVLYGTVPELVPRGKEARGFALFYTGTIGSGALLPVAYGAIGDLFGYEWGVAAAAGAALLACPLALLLAPRLSPGREAVAP